MCIIVALNPNKTVSEETLKTCWDANDDGAGFMFAKDNTLNLKKGFMNWESFKTAWKDVPQDCSRVIHFRIKTHGESNEENTHPFLVTKGLGFVHNGVISGVSNSNKKFSDTWHFNEEFLKQLQKYDGKFLTRSFNIKLIEKYINNSKLVFLDKKGHLDFVNKNLGVQESEGVWFSNTSFKKQTVVSSKTSYTPKKYYSGASQYIPEFTKGEIVVIANNLPSLQVQKGDIGYVENISGNRYNVIVHKYDPITKRTLEISIWVFGYQLETNSFEDYESSYLYSGF